MTTLLKTDISKDGVLLPLTYWPDPILSVACRPFEDTEEVRHNLVASMIRTMRHHNGAGLAAPQVGVDLQVAVVEVHPGEVHCIINPFSVLWDATADPFTYNEGCLSIPGYYRKSRRAGRVVIGCENYYGESCEQPFTDLESFAVQHELEHLQGKLFIDNLSLLKKNSIRRKVKKHINRVQTR